MDKKQRLVKKNLKHGVAFASKFGDFIETSVGKALENHDYLAYELPENPESNTWYRVTLDKGMSGDGSEYYIYVKIGDPDKLCIFFSGGGMAWNEYTAARPVTVAATDCH